ncbi:MAG: adenylyl-sulfate kinase [Myxococcota bacterium]
MTNREPKATNVTWHAGEVSAADRQARFGHAPACVWLTGLSASGKSTVARRVERRLVERGVVAYVLDGDNLRHGLNHDLGFAPADREENIRRIGEVSRLFFDAGVVVLGAFVSPYAADRARVRSLYPPNGFFEVHVATPLEVCEARDPKGLYRRARAGEIPHFTGISAPYEAPTAPALRIGDGSKDVEESAGEVLALLERSEIVSRTG